MTLFEEKLLLAGFSGLILPRLVRKVFARTALHRAWLSGFSGAFLLPVLERYGPDSK